MTDVVVVTAGAVMVTVVAPLVEAVNAVGSLGVKTAVIECDPAALNVVVVLALPALTFTAAPMFVEPSLNCTCPAAPDGDTVADSATLAPVRAEVGDAVRLVVVAVAEAGGKLLAGVYSTAHVPAAVFTVMSA